MEAPKKILQWPHDFVNPSQSDPAVAFLPLFRITPGVRQDPGRGLNGSRTREGPEGPKMARLPVSPLTKVHRLAFPKASARLSAGEQKERRMPLYEHVFLARQDVSGQQVEALVDQFR